MSYVLFVNVMVLSITYMSNRFVIRCFYFPYIKYRGNESNKIGVAGAPKWCLTKCKLPKLSKFREDGQWTVNEGCNE